MTLMERRKKAGLSRLDVAHTTGVALITIGRYERGDRKPTADNLVKLSKLYGCTIEELLGENHVG